MAEDADYLGMESNVPDAEVSESPSAALPYEFGRQKELDDNAVREVRTLFEAFGERLGELWSRDMRSAPTIEVGEVTKVAQDGLIEWLPEGSEITIGTFPPLLGNAALVIPTELALNMIDLLLGGNGQWSPPARQLTAIEAAMLKPVSESIMTTLGTSLAGDASHPKVSANGRNPVELELPKLLGDVIAIEIKLVHNEKEMRLHVALSMDLSAALVSELSEPIDDLDDSPSRDLLSKTLIGLDIELTVEFPSVKVRSAELLSLSPGDLLHLDCRTDEPLLLRSSGSTLAAVRPARAGENLAIQVVAFPYNESSRTRTTQKPTALNLGEL